MNSADCTALPGNFENVVPMTQLPVTYGSVMTISCDIGPYTLIKGSDEIICMGGDEFSFLEKPRCVVTGMICKTIFLDHYKFSARTITYRQ